MSPIVPSGTPARRTSRRARWRTWIGRYLLAALILPSLGPLPWLLAGAGIDAHAVAIHHAHDHEHAGHAHHDHRNPSDVPGSPTHPAGHDCFACQVLAQLARCCSLFTLPALEPPNERAACTVRCADAPVELATYFALVPPARAPPPRGA